MTRARSELDMHESLYLLACDYPTIPGTDTKGVKALAQILGMPLPTLRNKLSPDIETHKVSFEEAAAIMELCARAGMADAYAPLAAMNWRLGFVATERDDVMLTDDDCIHRAGSEVMQHVGAAFGEANSALDDGAICPQELEKIESRFRRATQKFTAWFARVRSRAKKDAAQRAAKRAHFTTAI